MTSTPGSQAWLRHGNLKAASKVFVNDDDAGEAQLTCAVGECVLLPLAFEMGADLLGGRLPHVDVSGSL